MNIKIAEQGQRGADRTVYIALTPVSYTHLDVYKRQSGDLPDPGALCAAVL